ncbi:hypothetical protein SGLAM104S_03165 [Streptomyces glaucescens]
MTVPALSGGITAATCGASWAAARVRRTACAAAGSVIVDPSGAVNTICALVPAAAGKSSAMVSCARWDSEPGIVNSLSSSPPTAISVPTAAARTASQTASTSRRRRWAPSPSR